MTKEQRDIYNDLKANGRAVTLRVTTTIGADPASGNPGTETTVDYATYAIQNDMTQVQRAKYSRDLGIDIAVDTRSLMVAALGIAVGGTLAALPILTTAMSIIDDDGAVLSIMSPGPARPASDVLYYDVLAKGA